MFVEWILAVCRHWVLLLTGTALALAGILYAQFGPDPIPGEPDVPMQAFFGIAAICLFGAFFVVWRDEHQKVLALTAQVESTPTPEISVKKIKGPDVTRLHLPPKHARSKEHLYLHAWQVWFVNKPRVRSDASIAKALMAEVIFYNAQGRSVFNEALIGLWAVTRQPGHAGWETTTSHVDLAAAPSVGKLVLIGHTPLSKSGADASGENSYALPGENFHAHAEGDHPKFRLPDTTERIGVTLSAHNMNDQQFVFRITRNEAGAVAGISQVLL